MGMITTAYLDHFVYSVFLFFCWNWCWWLGSAGYGQTFVWHVNMAIWRNGSSMDRLAGGLVGKRNKASFYIQVLLAYINSDFSFLFFNIGFFSRILPWAKPLDISRCRLNMFAQLFVSHTICQKSVGLSRICVAVLWLLLPASLLPEFVIYPLRLVFWCRCTMPFWPFWPFHFCHRFSLTVRFDFLDASFSSLRLNSFFPLFALFCYIWFRLLDFGPMVLHHFTCIVGWLFSCLHFRWLVGWLVSWLVGWSVGSLIFWPFRWVAFVNTIPPNSNICPFYSDFEGQCRCGSPCAFITCCRVLSLSVVVLWLLVC